MPEFCAPSARKLSAEDLRSSCPTSRRRGSADDAQGPVPLRRAARGAAQELLRHARGRASRRRPPIPVDAIAEGVLGLDARDGDLRKSSASPTCSARRGSTTRWSSSTRRSRGTRAATASRSVTRSATGSSPLCARWTRSRSTLFARARRQGDQQPSSAATGSATWPRSRRTSSRRSAHASERRARRGEGRPASRSPSTNFVAAQEGR